MSWLFLLLFIFLFLIKIFVSLKLILRQVCCLFFFQLIKTFIIIFKFRTFLVYKNILFFYSGFVLVLQSISNLKKVFVSICSLLILFIERQKYAQKFWSWDLVYKKPFGYRVVHQNSLTSCLGQLIQHYVF